MPCDHAEYSEGHYQIWTVTRLLLLFPRLFQSGERPACTASLVALLEAEGSVSDSGLLDLATACNRPFSAKINSQIQLLFENIFLRLNKMLVCTHVITLSLQHECAL